MAKKEPETEEPYDPFGPAYDPTKPPFIVDGVNPASNPELSAEERLDWLVKQQAIMKGRA